MSKLLSLSASALLCFAAACDSDDPAPGEEMEAMCPGEPMLHMFELSAETVAVGGTLDATFHVENFEFSMEGEGGHDHDELERDDESEFRGGDEEGGHEGGHEEGGHEEGGHEHSGACPVGHVHVYIDDLMSNPIAQQTHMMGELVLPSDIEPGEHTLIARLHTADHKIIEPQVIVEKTITVE